MSWEIKRYISCDLKQNVSVLQNYWISDVFLIDPRQHVNIVKGNMNAA